MRAYKVFQEHSIEIFSGSELSVLPVFLLLHIVCTLHVLLPLIVPLICICSESDKVNR